MMMFSVELKNPQTGSMHHLKVDADSALEAINAAKAWNPSYSEIVSCQMVKGRF